MIEGTSGLNDLVIELDQIKFIGDEGTASLHRLYLHYSEVFIYATEEAQLHFSTLFSRMSFALSRKSYPGVLKYHLHHFRVQVENLETADPQPADGMAPEKIFAEGKWALLEFLEKLSGQPLDIARDFEFEPDQFTKSSRGQKQSFVREMKVLVIGAGNAPNTLRAISQDEPDREVRISYGHIGRNDLFSKDIRAAFQYPGVPFAAQLVDVDIEPDGILVPKMIIIEPDLLIDVSTVAECTTDLNHPEVIHILRKYLPVEQNPAILMGGVANLFLDTLIRQPDSDFDEVFREAFHFQPLAFTCLSDQEIIGMMNKARGHFRHLQEVIREDFPRLQIDREQCVIEPSFYAPAFGIQGRLDLYHESAGSVPSADIIELKSGKLFRPNNYGLNANHYAQTLLYDLLVTAVKAFRQKNKCYILYSGIADNTLKFAPAVESLQKEAIHTRNQIVATEVFFQKASPDLLHAFLLRIDPGKFPRAKGYHLTNLHHFHEVYNGLDPSERIYFNLFSGFIAREYALSKVGEQGIETVNGLASLWLDQAAEKEQKFSIYRHLHLVELAGEEEGGHIMFQLPAEEDVLTNFRVGDIAVLYPDTGRRDDVLRCQIFKCTLTEIRQTHIQVRLRNPQINRQIFKQHGFWNLEHDILDSSFSRQFQSLFTFARQPAVARSYFLGSIAPRKPVEAGTFPEYPGLIAEQAAILRKMVKARDYFLLWGPPGTGKTSIMIRYAVDYYLRYTKKNLLLTAYTNRAVDEICAAVDRVSDDVRSTYVRFGSRVSTSPGFRDQLFSVKSEAFSKRREVAEFLDEQRIVIGTISSLIGNEELLKLKQFDIAIIDEASQILEPMLAGLLPRIDKKILIGDHKQLPAVVIQPAADTRVDEKRMEKYCLTDMRDSYFERMYRLCIKKNWNWAFDRLSCQGRMHKEIMDLANAHFYQGSLSLLPVDSHTASDQDQPLDFLHLPEPAAGLHAAIGRRIAYIPANVTDQDRLHKTNADEAGICVSLIRLFREVYALNGKPWGKDTLGVITPFRAQIALIRRTCHEEGLDPDEITIDTVERYQGSARDVIILSTAVTSRSQLSRIIEENHEKIDRKLNVSLTRARQQFIMTGDPETLGKNETYASFMKRYSIK